MALNENVVREQNERIAELVRTPAFLVAASSLTGLAVATSVENGIAIGAVSAVAIVAMALVARPLRALTGIWARIPVLLMVSATIVTLVSFAVRIIDPLIYQNLGIYLPLAAVNVIVAAFIYDDGFAGGPAKGSTMGTALFCAVCAFCTLPLWLHQRHVRYRRGLWPHHERARRFAHRDLRYARRVASRARARVRVCELHRRRCAQERRGR